MLIAVGLIDDEGNDRDTPQITVIEEQITKDAALGEVKQLERNDINLDLRDRDADVRDDLESRLARVDTLTWPEAANDDGHFVIDSVNQLGISEGGFEYRFVPITIKGA
jgi:hypothetical protein